MRKESLVDPSIGKRNYILFTIAIFGSFAIFGISDNIKGTALPRIQTEFLLTELHLGLLLAISSIGYLAACSFTAAMAKRIGIRTCLIIGLVIIASSGILIFSSASFFALVLGFFILNVGFGMLEIAVGVIAATIFTRKTGTMMNLAHFFFGAGATLSPILSTSLMTARFGDQLFGWRYVYIIILSFAILPAIPVVFGRLRKQERDKSSTGYAIMLKNPVLWLLVFILSFTLVCELGIAAWFVLFLEASYSFSTESAAFHLTLYFLCFTLGRLVLGPVIDRIGFINSLAFSTVLAGIMVIVGVLSGRTGVTVIVFAGAVVAPVFPTVMAVIAKLFADRIEHAMTAIMTTIGIIIVPSNLIVGVIINQIRLVLSDIYGDDGIRLAYSAGFLFLGLCCFGAFAFAMILRKRQKRAGMLV